MWPTLCKRLTKVRERLVVSCESHEDTATPVQEIWLVGMQLEGVFGAQIAPEDTAIWLVGIAVETRIYCHGNLVPGLAEPKSFDARRRSHGLAWAEKLEAARRDE